MILNYLAYPALAVGVFLVAFPLVMMGYCWVSYRRQRKKRTGREF